MARKRSGDFWVSVITTPFLLYVLFLIIRTLISSNNDFFLMGYGLWIIALLGYIYYVFMGVRKRYG